MTNVRDVELRNIMNFEDFGFSEGISHSEVHDFDFGNNLSTLINNKYKFLNVSSDKSNFLNNENTEVDKRLCELRERGYSVSEQVLSLDIVNAIYDATNSLSFRNKGRFAFELKGRTLNLINHFKIGSTILSDTFWLQDFSQFCNSEIVKSIAYSPYILNVVGGYLGCPPILVQTNMWHSFPGGIISKLSGNGQAYHQDKEFVKFIKVFVYLTDVNINNGPHCYFSGSHRDEAIQKGYEYSSRISDEQCYRLYGKHNEKIVTGMSGTIIFGDTSAVHKGMPVISGRRAIFQLEYASTLYKSPVERFNCNEPDLSHLNLSESVKSRITSNYL